MNIDFNIFDFIDILFIVMIPIAMMVWMTFWLQRQERSRKMILFLWGFFVGIVFVGLTCLLVGIQAARVQWLDYFGEMAAAYSIVVSRLDHWKIIAGDENTFSEWSDPTSPILPAETQDEPNEWDTSPSLPPEIFTAGTENTQEKLSTPEHFSAVRLSPTHVSLYWSPVPGATTYRVQRGKPSCEDGVWECVYSGAACKRFIPDTDSDFVYRLRAETGTPEDDPTYIALMEACSAAASESKLIAYIYTMRAVDEDTSMFIICPGIPEDDDDTIDMNEQPTTIAVDAPIGTEYPNTKVMSYVFSHKVPAINTIPAVDEWGTWVTAFYPLLDPEGNFDGAVGVDFEYSLWSSSLYKAKIWPYSFFFILTILFFGSTYLIVLNQRSSEDSKHIADQLQDSVVKLTVANKAAEAAVQAKGYFLANMSHEIRTPMNAVIGFADFIGRKLMQRCLPEERKQCQESVELITSSGNDLLTIINDILDFSKVESDQIEVESIPISLSETIEGIHSIMLDRLKGKDNLTLEFMDEGGVPELMLSDPTRLRQILNNLISNAIKFTETGTVTVRYGIESGTALAKTVKQQNMLFVEVRDTGIGMTSDQLCRLFQPFTQADSTLTRRFGGTGLGLSIAKRLAVLLGGDILVTSQMDEGSVFTLRLPIREPSAEDIRNRNEKLQKRNEFRPSTSTKSIELTETKPLSGLAILVVEDGRVNQIVIMHQLTEAGASVTLAEDGQAAIESISTKESAGAPFDVVLMDMQMPIMDGYEATSRLRHGGYTLPIIAITAHALTGDSEKTLEVGCNAYLSKPVNREQLIRTIRDVGIKRKSPQEV